MSKTESLVERRVTYTLEIDGKLYVVENVPAHVDEETGEQFFAPSTVERLHRMILEPAEPSKMLETPVYEYSE
jgi:YgiT-type zinc finger domain-containing protein